MNLTTVTVLGGGTIGSQIAMQAFYKGCDVTIYDISDEAVFAAKKRVGAWSHIYAAELMQMKENFGKGMPYSHGLVEDIVHVTPEELDRCIARASQAGSITFTTNIEDAVKEADLVIEAVLEHPAVKKAVFGQIADKMKEDTILATNSSTLLPSMFAEITGRPDKFIAMHFANYIWKNNTIEIMRHEGTSDDTFETAVAFAKRIGMVPLCLNKEQPGYILNSLLVPFLDAAEKLLAKDVASVETIDLTWRLSTGSPYGPFQILDIVGLKTAYTIVAMKPEAKDENSDAYKIMKTLESYISAGKLGVSTGEGFYVYRK